MTAPPQPLPDPAALTPRLLRMCEELLPKVEFESFLLGVRIKQLAKPHPADVVEAWKKEIKRAWGTAQWEAWQGERSVDFHRPHVQLVYDVDRDRVRFEPRSIYVYGRYRKLIRDLPQTAATWRCPHCEGKRGSDCEPCGGTGRKYPVALGDLVGRPTRTAFRGRRYTFHGMGREDVDVRCLGGGRPFVVEISSPFVRTVDLEALREEIVAGAEGKLELPSPLHRVEVDLVGKVKNWASTKTYEAVCAGSGPLDPDAVAALPQALAGTVLEQRTPVRVSRRRADKVRKRKVLRFELGEVEEDRFTVIVQAEAGTYIKELISGDEGRTQPSVAGLLGVETVCARLDVLEIGVEDAEILASAEPAH
jgi:tRNA pseudouridine synthase 10